MECTYSKNTIGSMMDLRWNLLIVGALAVNLQQTAGKRVSRTGLVSKFEIAFELECFKL